MDEIKALGMHKKKSLGNHAWFIIIMARILESYIFTTVRREMKKVLTCEKDQTFPSCVESEEGWLPS